MRDLLYLKDDQIKNFIEQIFYAYRKTYSDPKKILKKYSFGTAHHRAIHLIERHEGLTISDLLNKLKITKQSLNRVLRDLIKCNPWLRTCIFTSDQFTGLPSNQILPDLLS